MKSRRKMILILIIFVIVIVLGLGYAYLTTTLSINGTTDVDSNTWNVYWDNVQVTNGSVTGSQVTTAPTIDTNKTTVSFQVRLSKPGDYYEFTVDAKNTGSIDAMIDTITKTTSIPDYLKYEVTYNDDIPIEENHKLSANDTQTYKVKVEYKTDINANQLPSSSSSTTLTFGTTYIQADSNATERPYYIYTLGNLAIDEFSFFNAYEEPYFYNYNDAINEFGHQYYIKALVDNNKFINAYLGFVVNGKNYEFITFGRDYSFSTYTQSKEILLEAFGESNCEEEIDTISRFTCEIEDVISVRTQNGFSNVTDGDFMNNNCEFIPFSSNNGYTVFYSN